MLVWDRLSGSFSVFETGAMHQALKRGERESKKWCRSEAVLGNSRVNTIPVCVLLFVVSVTLFCFVAGVISGVQAQTINNNATDQSGPRVVVVGVERYPPLAFINKNNQADGLAIDILKLVAEREGWILEYTTGDFADLLLELQAGEIDILPTITPTPERRKIYRFTAKSYLSNWGVVFQREDLEIEEIVGLDGKRVARVLWDTHGAALTSLVDDFDIAVTWIDKPSFGAAIDAVRQGEADAAVVSRLFGFTIPDEAGVVNTDIQINPVKLHFAAPISSSDAYISAIDRLIDEQKNVVASEYRLIVGKWLAEKPPRWRDNPTLVILLASGFGTAVLFIVVATVFRFQLRRKTQELRDASTQLEDALNALSNAVIIVTSNGTVCYANSQAEALFGRPGKTIVETIVVLPKPDEESSVVQVRASDGTEHDVEIQSTPMDHRGEKRTLVSVRDVTEKKAAERAAERSYELVNAVLENVSDGIIACDSDGNITTFNRVARKLLGLPDDLLVLEDWSKYYALYYADGVTPILKQDLPLFTALNGHPVRDFEVVVDPLIKNMIHLVVNATPMKDRLGERLGAVATLQDVTISKQANAKIVESEQRFRSAFDSGGHGIALVATDGKWLQVNDGLCKMLGYDREELLQTDIQSLTYPEDLEADLELIQELLDGDIESYQMEKRYHRKDGTIMPSMLSVGLVRDIESDPLHFVSQIIDLSAAKEAEKKLLQAQKMEAVGNLTGGIAHDFNNILGIILGNLQLLERKIQDDPKLMKYASTAVEATRRGADLTRQLLVFSRRQELEPRVIDANEFVSNMYEMLQRTLGENVEIKTDLADDLGMIKADPAQLESAILNLSINARDAMVNGGRLIIETSNEMLDVSYTKKYEDAKQGQNVCISITDTGAGISEEHIREIFKPFFTTKDVGKGTGLGLSMVYGFVRQSGGHVNVYSELGHGTRFRLYFPTTTDTQGTGIEAVVDEIETGSEVILLVEDQTELRETTVLQLEDLGYTVVAASDGKDALESLALIKRINLLFTDMIMPGGMNGQQLAKEVLELDPDVSVLLTSGYPRDAFAEGREFQLLQKPFTHEQLAQAVRVALNKEPQSQGSDGL